MGQHCFESSGWVLKAFQFFFSLTLRYPAHIEDIDYEEGKVLIHFKRWNHRYDEWFCWDSPYLRPLEKIQLRKEGLHAEEGSSVSNKSGQFSNELGQLLRTS
mgnify:CR=1 FL=1